MRLRCYNHCPRCVNFTKRFQLYQQDKVKQLQILVLVKFLETIEGCLFANSCSNTWAGLILFLPLSWKHLIMKVFELVPKIWIFVGCCWSQAAAGRPPAISIHLIGIPAKNFQIPEFSRKFWVRQESGSSDETGRPSSTGFRFWLFDQNLGVADQLIGPIQLIRSTMVRFNWLLWLLVTCHQCITKSTIVFISTTSYPADLYCRSENKLAHNLHSTYVWERLHS